jgi:sialidase-1
VTQEPGVIELKDGRVFLFCRTDAGSQYVSYSSDGGDTWPPLAPSNMRSPCSPATIKRIPMTGDLILVWNDYSDSACQGDGPRTPLRVAVSRDEGLTWEHVKTLEGDPKGHYCYTALEFVGQNDVLLGYCAGSRDAPLAFTQLTRFSLDWLYK